MVHCISTDVCVGVSHCCGSPKQKTPADYGPSGWGQEEGRACGRTPCSWSVILSTFSILCSLYWNAFCCFILLVYVCLLIFQDLTQMFAPLCSLLWTSQAKWNACPEYSYVFSTPVFFSCVVIAHFYIYPMMSPETVNDWDVHLCITGLTTILDT